MAEDATTTEEVPVAVSEAKEKALAAEEVQVEVSVATEVQLQEAADSDPNAKVVFQTVRHVKADSAEEAKQEVPQLQDAKADSHQEEQKVSQTEHHAVRKVHPMHQEKEDQEKANIHLLIFL